MENRVIAMLRERLPKGRRQLVGLGDDAEALDWSHSNRCVVTTDLLAAGVHFEAGESLVRVGRKSMAVNLSDLAAMAARPVAAFVSLLLPKQFNASQLNQLYDGMTTLANEFDLCIAGGDTNSWNGPLVISLSMVGDCEEGHLWTRAGGQAGDAIVVTGTLGGSILGHHLDFTPRVRESRAVASKFDIHAAMDISDGLLLDLARLSHESQLGAEIDFGAIPVSEAARTLSQNSTKSAHAHALSDGEDFELLLCLSERDATSLCQSPPCDLRFTRIGQLVDETGLRHAGTGIAIEPTGYEH